MGSPAAPLHELDCALSGPGLNTAKARENPVEDYVETQGAAEPPPPPGRATTHFPRKPARRSRTGRITMPANATGHEQRQRPIQRSNHPRRVITMRDLQHSFHSDRHQAHAPIPLETRLDKYLLRWFLQAGDRPSRTSQPLSRTKMR